MFMLTSHYIGKAIPDCGYQGYNVRKVNCSCVYSA